MREQTERSLACTGFVCAMAQVANAQPVGSTSTGYRWVTVTPSEVGTLASLDPALILTPPRGLEVGYVPIATRQELAGAASRSQDQGKARQ